MNRFILIFFLLLHLTMRGHSQSSDLKFPDRVILPDNFKEAIADRVSEFERLFHNDSTCKNYSTAFILDKIDTDSNYGYLFIAEYWIAFHYSEIIPELIKRLTIKKEIGLVNSADLIIIERVRNKQMQLYGHGGVCTNDLFTIAGRANQLLAVVTGENFGNVSMYSTKEQLEKLQRSWIKWLKALPQN